MTSAQERKYQPTVAAGPDTNLCSLLFKKFLDVTSDGYIAINRDGRIIEINKSYCALLNISHEEALTKNVIELIPNTGMLRVLESGITEIDVLDRHESGVLKGKHLICSRSVIERDGIRIAAFAQVRYSRKTIEVAQTFQKVDKELEYYKKEYKRFARDNYNFDKIIGTSPYMLSLKSNAMRAAAHDFTILLQGETGTGKEVFAHAIHNASPRSHAPFIRLNCAAIPAELFESELFGYEEGAFSGARRGGKPGRIELADQGTLFLDEIGDMPLSMQAKLLRVLQDQELDRLGGTGTTQINVRVIAATNQDLGLRVKEGRFRADLYFRLNVINLQMIPLRARPEDIIPLAECYLAELNCRYETRKSFHPSILPVLRAYPWLGNGRELRNAVEYAFSFSDSPLLAKESLPPRIFLHNPANRTRHAGEKGLAAVLKEVEAGILRETLDKYNGNYDKAARALKIHRTTLYKKMRVNNAG
ncbi:MAG: sigma 54-interacting transcriptional regulator [Deltaproteobacteria bacterium]|jgi:transcriptional regulator with PAS, ATPase and Fis domain|nr:sigma 54-interacting transcriptional regulator [Deltaproteobacteria bacterium]